MTSRNGCASRQFLIARRVRSSRFATSVKVRDKEEEPDSKRRKRLFVLSSRDRSNNRRNRLMLNASSDVSNNSSDASKRRRLNVQRDQRDSKHRVNALPHLGSNNAQCNSSGHSNNGHSSKCVASLVP